MPEGKYNHNLYEGRWIEAVELQRIHKFLMKCENNQITVKSEWNVWLKNKAATNEVANVILNFLKINQYELVCVVISSHHHDPLTYDFRHWHLNK